MGKYERKKKVNVGMVLLTLLLSAAAIVVTGKMLLWGLVHVGTPGNTDQSAGADLAIMDRYEMQMTNQVSSALEGILSIEKVYWLNDEDLIAPEPDQENFGKCSDPGEMQWFLDASAGLLDGQKTLFSTETQLYAGSEVTYYLDDTIMVITWQQVCHNAVYTISEVKIAHPSQFRRFLADGTYGSDKQYKTTDMAKTVNAVTASSGDFYKFRSWGVSVYNGQVMRVSDKVDTCYITEEGDMLFTYRGEIKTTEQAQQFVEENNVRFSLAFGPVLVDNYEKKTPSSYPLGEINDQYSRAAIAKMGDLHYLMVAVNQGKPLYGNVPTASTFADQLIAFGVEKAYSLDGGQTAAIVTNDELISRPDWGTQRLISDIIYFATALPDGG